MTQAWLFTGLAIRMIQDLGIHLAIDDPGLDEHFDHEVREVRVRLYWSGKCLAQNNADASLLLGQAAFSRHGPRARSARPPGVHT